MTTISDVVTNRLSTNKACGFGRLAISADLKPLPVEISLFFAFEDKVVNRLEWNTVSEINNDYFIVEWSLNGEDWFFLAKNDGAGTTTREQHYSATHRHPSSKTYYRLKQADFDEKFSYSEIIKVVRSISTLDILMFPNPTANRLKIANIKFDIPFDVRIQNMHGVTVYSKAFEGIRNKYKWM